MAHLINPNHILVTSLKDTSLVCPQWQPANLDPQVISDLESTLQECTDGQALLTAVNLYQNKDEAIWSFSFITTDKDQKIPTLILKAIQEWGDNDFIFRSIYTREYMVLITASIS